jgi:hypothetical protein
MKFIHLGHYNDIADLKRLCTANADEIMYYKLNGNGNFYELIDDNGIDITNADEIVLKNPQFTHDNDYAVVFDIPTDIEYIMSLDDDDFCDFFIDIYKVIEEPKMVSLDNVCEWLKKKNELCDGGLSNILGTKFIEDFRNEMTELETLY